MSVSETATSSSTETFGMPLGRFQLEAAIQSVHCDRGAQSGLAAALRRSR